MYLNFKMIGAGCETQNQWYRIQTALMGFGIHRGFNDLDVGLTTILI
jgi:hypothetical protein